MPMYEDTCVDCSRMRKVGSDARFAGAPGFGTCFHVHGPYNLKKLSVTMRPAGSSHPDRTLLIASCAAVLAAWLVPAAAQDFPADVNRGKTVYQRHCLSCHGTGGWGDGPAAEALRVPPTNFHRFSSVIKTDEELLRTIEHGVVFSPMHSWQGRLTGSERRDALAYIRLLMQQAR